MVSVTHLTNDEHSIGLKADTNASKDEDIPLEMDDQPEPPSITNLKQKDDFVASPPKASKTETINSPRASLSRNRRQPNRFKDFDSDVLNKFLKKRVRRSLQEELSEVENEDNAETDKNPAKKIPLKKRALSHGSPSTEKSSATAEKIAEPPKFNVAVGNSDAYESGSLLWCKLSSHPYWPCIVCPDPETGLCHKSISAAGRKSFTGSQTSDELVSCHVRFFGPKHERCWTNPKYVIAYEGGQKYLDNMNQMISESKANSVQKKKGKKKKACSTKTAEIIKVYGIKPATRKAWDAAVEEANQAMSLSIVKRTEKYKQFFAPPKEEKDAPQKDTPSKSLQKKRKSVDPKQDTPKKAKMSDEFEFDPAEPLGSFADFRMQMKSNETSVKKPPKSKEDVDVYQFATAKPVNKCFEVFYQKIKPNLKNSHKSLSEKDLKSLAEKLWGKMSSKQQSRYKSHTATPKLEKGSARKADPEPSSPDTSPASRKSAMKIKIGKFGKFEASIDSSICKDENSDEDEGPTPASIQSLRIHRILEDSGSNSSAESVSSTDDANAKRKSKSIRKSNLPSVSPYEDKNGNGHQVCTICEKPNSEDEEGDESPKMISCGGSCHRFYHTACVSVKDSKSTYTCPDCISGVKKCFICKEQSADLVNCSVLNCGKMYHVKCVKQYPTNSIYDGNKAMTCPMHSCLTCINNNLADKICKTGKLKLVRCLRCPTTYHRSASCIGAGCSLITQSLMICHKHFEPSKKNPQHSKINVNWCFICSVGGSLICCESCPAAFHADCLNIDAPDGSFYCDDCSDHRQPRYGHIVWAKLGYYRWWPAVICNPKDLPKNVLALKHSVGEFPVKFYGSHDYFWLNRRRIFSFHEGDKGSKIQTQNHLNRVFNKAVVEATEAFKEWSSNLQTTHAKLNEKIELKPKYKHIKVNRTICKLPGGPSEQPACECEADVEHPCGEYSSCINRMMMIECNPNICNARDKCENQSFEKRLYPKVVPFRTGETGWGLHCEENIKQGRFVIEYVGEIVDEAECKKRLKQMNIENNKKFYFLTLDKDRIIDAGPKGNYARFMNHSCNPNCETQKWTVNGETRVGLFALENIPAFTELTFNYNLQCLGDERITCMCGAANCSGYIGVPPKALPSEQKNKSKPNPKRKKKQKAVINNNICFKCGDKEDLICCSRKDCKKFYHIKCLEIDSPLSGKWDCPWHQCDSCGKPSIQSCSKCPTSFCRLHSKKSSIKMSTKNDSKYICNNHEEFSKI